MGNDKVVIYDSNIPYAERLMNYIKTNTNLDVYMFTLLDKLNDYAKSHQEDLYLLKDSDDIRRIMSELNLNGMLLTENKQLEKSGLCNCIYRYKSAGKIIEDINQILNKGIVTDAGKGKLQVCTFTSLFHCLDLDNVMLEVSRECIGDVLIVDFRYINPWSKFIPNTKNGELSDLIYAQREKTNQYERLMSDYVHEFLGANIIFGLDAQGDMSEITASDIDELVTALAAGELYQRIIIVIDQMMLEIIQKSFAGKHIVIFTRDSEKEKEVIERYWSNIGKYRQIRMCGLSEELERAIDGYGSWDDFPGIRRVINELRQEGIL